MTTALERILAKSGKTIADIKATSRVGRALRRGGVRDTEELRRIYTLTKRSWTDEEITLLVEGFTEMFKTPNGSQTLRSHQAVALAEFHDQLGYLGPFPVGEGKTHVTFLAPLVIEAKRPLLIVPGRLRTKTINHFSQIERHWKRHPNITIVTYEKLGRISGDRFIERLKPDLIIADECHKIKNIKSAAVAKRVHRWFEEYPDTMFIGLSGTIIKRSLFDFHHLTQWALGIDRMPLPVSIIELTDWADAVDARVKFGQRVDTKALRVFNTPDLQPGSERWKEIIKKPEEQGDLEEVRKSLGQRILQTPGISAPRSSDVEASIILEFHYTDLPSEIESMIEAMYTAPDFLSPNGDSCESAARAWIYQRELSSGFFYKWEPPPPKYWLEARRSWNRLCRSYLEQQISGLDTDLQVRLQAKKGNLGPKAQELLEKWYAVKQDYIPEKHKKAEWITDVILKQALNLIKEPTLIWVEHVATGERLASLSGLSYFHREGLNSKGVLIDSLEGRESAIVSIKANSEGRNLQAWSNNIVIFLPPNGADCEQLIGRTSRSGQEADEVNVHILTNRYLDEDIEKAKITARNAQMLDQPQKLLISDWVNYKNIDHLH